MTKITRGKPVRRYPGHRIARRDAETLAMTCWDIQNEMNSGLFKFAYGGKNKVPLDYVTDAILEWLDIQGVDVDRKDKKRRKEDK